ncbi:MAG: uracil-DNA glycosylase [Nitriliruptor sp.]|nr:MAG: uracil-DNA glycosylase [Nitriliruptor sp.]
MAAPTASPFPDLEAVSEVVIGCRACPRLVAWREQVASERRAAYADETYWGRPVPGFGDPRARVVVVGLAPAAHGANRTGRIFTGDRSGDWLFASLHRTGFANQARSVSRDDGLGLTGVYVTAAVRCAPPDNRPSVAERDRCAPYLAAELDLLPWRVTVALGGFAWDAVLRQTGWSGRKPRFGHGSEVVLPDGRVLLGSYHVSQQNTFTGRLTEEMLDAVFLRAREIAADSSS